MKLFRKTTVEDSTNILGMFLPGGRIFSNKQVEGSKLRNLLVGLAIELNRIEEKMNLISEDHDIYLTEQLIEEWEAAVGIPGECLLGDGTLEERRMAILVKFAKMNITTAQDYIDLANLFEVGLDMTVEAGMDRRELFGTDKEARFSIVISFAAEQDEFPLTFPFTFGIKGNEVIRCLFSRVKPANVQLYYA